jgi:uncharacterized protein (DUF1778 family)
MQINAINLIDSLVRGDAATEGVQAAANITIARKTLDLQQQMMANLLSSLPAPVSANPNVGTNLDRYA